MKLYSKIRYQVSIKYYLVFLIAYANQVWRHLSKGSIKLNPINYRIFLLIGNLCLFFKLESAYACPISLICKTDSLALKTECVVLNLTNAVSRALNCNRQLLGTVENLTQAQYGIDLAKNDFQISITPNSQAGYRGDDQGQLNWTLGGGINISKKFTSGTLVAIEPSVIKRGQHVLTDFQAVITQPLLRGLGKEYQLANLKGAQFALRSAYRTLYIAQVQLVLRTIQALYDIIKLEKGLQLHQESYQRIQQFHQAAKLKEKIGLFDALDVYRAEIELRQAEDALKSSEEKLEEAKDNIRDLLALPLDCDVSVDVPLLFNSNPKDLEQAIQSALSYRIEMQQAQDEWNENQRLSKMAKKNLYPELNLVLNYANTGRAKHFNQACSVKRENSWGIGFTTAFDSDPLAEKIAYEQSLMAMTMSARHYEQTEVTLILEVKRTIRQLNRAYARIHLQQKQIQTAQAELYLAKVKFDHGMSDNFNVLQAEKSLRSAQQTYWSTLVDHLVGEFQLLAAMGLLIDQPAMPQ